MSHPGPTSAAERKLRRANPSTIQGKFLVGYQGWFTCAGDGEPIGPGHHGWLHWFNSPIPHGGRPNLDLWPDVSSYGPSELYPAPGLKTRNGEDVFLFSSRNAKTVQRHFRWMAEHGVDGAFLQRFAGQCDPANEGIRRLRDEVGDRVREAAEQQGRVFAIMYDVSGVPAERIQHILVQDWLHLMRNKRILESPNYLKEKGKPVVALWGFGFDNAGHTPALVRAIAQFFRSTTPGGVYLMAGTPASWRTAEGDADRNPEFADTWLNEFDAISPWTIGRYKNEEEADSFAQNKMKPDFDRIQQHNERSTRKVDYIPVVFPGGSGCNLSEGKWGFNDIPRKGGRFLWKQVFNAHRIGSRILYGAMWDEYDEGTAFMPVVTHKHKLPVSDRWQFMALDQDGHDLPSDWYMRISGFAAEVLRGERRLFETFPSKELQDYWATRPKYEDEAVTSAEASSSSGHLAGGSSSGGDASASSNQGGQSYEEWLSSQKPHEEDAPPPPYTLEAGDPSATSAPSTTTANQSAGIGSGVSSGGAPPAPGAASAYHGPASAPHAQVSDRPPASNGPPPVNMQSYPPAGQGYGQTPVGGPPTGAALGDPVTNLANQFGRVGLHAPAPGPGGSGVGTYHSGNASASPPPVHPAHPAAHHGRPPARPPTSSGSLHHRPSYSRPQSSQSNPSGSSPGPAPSAGSWSQPQWPPAEWQVGGASRPPTSPTGAPPPQSGYPGGANLTRPQTFSASSSPGSLNHSSSLRPHAPSLSARPTSAQANLQPTSPAGQSPSPYPPPNGPPPAPYSGSAYGGHGYGSYGNNMPGGPSSYGGPGSSYAPPGAPYLLDPNGPSRTSTMDSFVSQPSAYPYQNSNLNQPPYPAASSYPSSDANSAHVGYPVAHPAAWSGGASSGPPHGTSTTTPPISPGSMNTNFPNAIAYGAQPQSSYAVGGHGSSFPYLSGGDEPGGQYGNTMPHAHPNYQPPSGHNYSNPQHGSASASYQQQQHPLASSASFPAPLHPIPTPSDGMPWMPGAPTTGASSYGGPPPSLPPRPSNYSYNSSSASSTLSSSSSKPSGINFPAAGSSALGLAWSAVDKVAGRKTREQLESQVGSLAQSGSKLLGKFTK